MEHSTSDKKRPEHPKNSLRKLFHRFIGWLCAPFPVWVGALATAIIAFLTYSIFQVADEQKRIAEDSNKIFIASTRAWLAAGDIVVPERFITGESHEIYLTFGNIGKGPAHKVTADIQHFILPSQLIHDREGIRIVVNSRTRCDTLKPSDSGFVLFPSGKLDSRQRLLPTVLERGFLVSKEESQAKQGYFMVAGCFAYETFGKPRISRFCRYFDYNEGKTPKDWPSTFCDYREYAD